MVAESCAFCRIVTGAQAATVLHRDEQVVAFQDARPAAPIHVLVVPVRHVESLNELPDDSGELIGRLFSVARELAEKLEVDRSGYRLVLNTGRDAGQSVFHLHLHLMGGRSMGWPPG